MRVIFGIFVIICAVYFSDKNAKFVRAETIQRLNATKLVQNMLANYDKSERPNYGGPPVEIGITMYVIDVSEISDNRFTMQAYFRQFWKDPRLAFPLAGVPNTFIRISEHYERIWHPDTFFPTAVYGYMHTLTVPNVFCRISSDGSVLDSQRLTISVRCPFDLKYFPMDTQTCSLEIESYAYTMADMIYSWSKGVHSIGISPETSNSEFIYLGNRVKTQSLMLSTGNYSRLQVEFQFQRKLEYYLHHFYIPSIIVTLLAFFSLWMTPKAKSGRLALGIVATAAMSLILYGGRVVTPSASYLTGLDIYLGISLVFVLAILVQHAVIFHTTTVESDEEKLLEPCDKEKWKFSSFINEKYARICLGFLILLFNFLYWLIYTQNSGYNSRPDYSTSQ